MVAVADDEGERSAERPTVTKTREHLDLVGLELLARAPPVPLLAAAKVGIDPLLVECEPGRKAGHDRNEGGAVRLPCRREPERHGAILCGVSACGRQSLC